MNDQRPTRWPCSADSSRNAGPEPRSFRNAETGVSVSSMKVSHTGTRLLWVVSATPGKEELLGVRQAETARVQQDGQVVEDVGGLLRHPPVALLARRAGDLLGLLADLGPDAAGVVEQLDGVRAFGALGGTLDDHALERRERLVRRLRHEPAVVVRDVHGTPDIRPRRAARLVGPCRDRPTALVREAGPRGCAN